MTWTRIAVLVSISAAGFGCTWWAADNCRVVRLQAAAGDVGPGTYLLYVGLPLLGTLLSLIARFALRVRFDAVKGCTPSQKELGKVAAQYARDGAKEGLLKLADIAEYEAKRGAK